jgi:hypothetical protein
MHLIPVMGPNIAVFTSITAALPSSESA